jgi:hypothetical protein
VLSDAGSTPTNVEKTPPPPQRGRSVPPLRFTTQQMTDKRERERERERERCT